jgi:para-nitrobenzyl esterase
MLRACLFFVAALTSHITLAAPKVVTSGGTIVGETVNGVNVFKGVPYAQPPIGALRWAPPQPISWNGERAATTFALPCLQPMRPDGKPNGAGVTGDSSEDCLYLNVWAPANANNAPVSTGDSLATRPSSPVMLWLYGGGGTMGSGHVATYHGDAFARDGVVLVTINYRLGALAGFAHPSLTRAAKPGEGFANYHLLDAIAALQWVKANAAAFGGDASNVTLFGESAGATMVANLVTSPKAKGLFQKAIIESTGSLPTPATPLTKAEEAGVALAIAHGLSGKDATAEQLRAIPAQAIIADAKTGRGLRTILDGVVKTQSIMDGFASGAAIDVPMIIGTNSDEGRLSGTQRVATHAMSGAPVWQYFFDYVPDWRRAEQPNGAPHAAEIPYVFDTLAKDRTGGSRMTPKDHAVAAYIHSCWVAFAKAPVSSRSLTCADGFQWPARTDANGQAVALLQERPSLGKAPQLRSPPNGAKPGPTSRDEE